MSMRAVGYDTTEPPLMECDSRVNTKRRSFTPSSDRLGKRETVLALISP
jgi:hypothetical protein